MAKGQPDFGAYAPTETIVGISDLGELAARLGSIVTFDRRGNVIWLDDFEHGIARWIHSVDGVGAKISWSPLYAVSGSFSAELIAGSTLGRYAMIKRILPYPALSSLGLEFAFGIDTDLYRLSIEFKLFKGTWMYDARVYYDYVDQKLQYMDDNWDLIDLATGLNLWQGDYTFNILKVVVDFLNGNYVRVICNEQVHDMAGIAAANQADATVPRLEIKVTAFGPTGKNPVVYIDNVIVTQNEP